MGNPLIDLVVAIVALCGLIVVIGMLRGSSLYDRIGNDGPFPPPMPRPEPRPGTLAARTERDLEIRQMLQARNDRRVRNGQAPLDLDAELTRLLADPMAVAGTEPGGHKAEDLARHDPELVEELRQLAQARNQRRLRRGEEPLNVAAEVRRALAELDI